MKRVLKDKGKNLIGSIVFVSIALVMLVCISYILRPVDIGNRNALSGYYAEEDYTLDVVSIGGSGIYRFLNNPILWKEYGITSYNLGTGSQQSEVHEMLVNELLKSQTPDLLIVETRPFIHFNNEEDKRDIRFRRVSDYMNYSWDRIRYINEFTDDWEKRFNLYFDIMFYHGQWEKFEITNLRNVDNNEKTEMKGWSNVYECNPLEVPGDYDHVKAQPIDVQQEKALLNLIGFCKERDVQILFVATPWKMTEERVAQNKYLEQFISKQGYLFLNCNEYAEEMGLDYNVDFYDTMHTNVYGSEKVTRFIGDFISEHFDVDTSHTEKTRKDWDKAWNYYMEELQREQMKNAENSGS